MFLYINIMALKVLIVTISIFIFLLFTKYIEEIKENFISNLKQKKEHFNNISIQNVHADNQEDDESENNSETDETESIENSDSNNNTNENANKKK